MTTEPVTLVCLFVCSFVSWSTQIGPKLPETSGRSRAKVDSRCPAISPIAVHQTTKWLILRNLPYWIETIWPNLYRRKFWSYLRPNCRKDFQDRSEKRYTFCLEAWSTDSNIGHKIDDHEHVLSDRWLTGSGLLAGFFAKYCWDSILESLYSNTRLQQCDYCDTLLHHTNEMRFNPIFTASIRIKTMDTMLSNRRLTGSGLLVGFFTKHHHHFQLFSCEWWQEHEMKSHLIYVLQQRVAVITVLQ